MKHASFARRWTVSAAALLAAGLTLAGCPGGRSKDAPGAGDSAGAVRDTSQPQPRVSGDSAGAAAGGADSSRAVPGTARDTAQPRPGQPDAKPGAGAAQKAGAPKSSSGAGRTTTSEADTTRIRRLEEEARALANVTGCGESEQCRTAPVGHRACGGPRTYLAYCARTTDSAALFRKLDQLAQAERDYQAKHQIGSTCDFRSAPPVEASSNSCHLRTAQPGAGRLQTP